MWHVSSRSGVATLRTAIHLLFTYLLATWCVVKKNFYKLRNRWENIQWVTCSWRSCVLSLQTSRGLRPITRARSTSGRRRLATWRARRRASRRRASSGSGTGSDCPPTTLSASSPSAKSPTCRCSLHSAQLNSATHADVKHLPKAIMSHDYNLRPGPHNLSLTWTSDHRNFIPT